MEEYCGMSTGSVHGEKTNGWTALDVCRRVAGGHVCKRKETRLLVM